MIDEAFLSQALALAPEAKEELIERLWESLDEQGESIFPLTPAQRAELDRRLEDFEKNPDDWVPWEEVKRRLRGAP